MDEKLYNRRAQLFNLTITELLLLLIFLLLIFAGILFKTYHDLKEVNDKLNDQLHERPISKIYDCPNMDCEYVIVPEPDWNKKLSDAETAEETLSEYKDKIKKAENKTKEAEEELAEAKKDVKKAEERAEKAEKIAEEAIKDAEQAIADSQISKSELDEVRKEIAMGVGPPPCWIEPGTIKSTDFLFDLIMHSDGIQFRNSFPINRVDDFKSLPINIDYNRHYTIEEFRAVTSEIDSYGRNQVDKHPEGCRFYITMYDGLKDNEKKLLKDYQLEIQKVFYQRNEIRDL